MEIEKQPKIFSRREIIKGIGKGMLAAFSGNNLTRLVSQTTFEKAKTIEQQVLYEKDFEHLRNEDGEWEFGKIFWEGADEYQTTYYFTGVILGEPEKKPVKAYDFNNNLIHTYECWFAKIGYPDPQSQDKRLVSSEVLIWLEDMEFASQINLAKNGFVHRFIHTGIGYDTLIRDRDEFLSYFKYAEPTILTITSDRPNGLMRRILEQFDINEPFPGSTSRAKIIYFDGLLFDEENGIGGVDLPKAPTIEEIKAWKEQGQLPGSNFLGIPSRLIVSDGESLTFLPFVNKG